MATPTNMSRQNNVKSLTNVSATHYNHDVQFYVTKIPGHIKLEDLRELGVVRLTILRIVIDIAERHEVKDSKICLEELATRLKSHGLESFADLFTGSGCNVSSKERRWTRWRDHVSHNTACLALSQNSEHEKWLINAENKLIQWRVSALSNEGILAFLRTHNIQYPMVDENEKIRLKNCLISLMEEPEEFDETIFYKVPYKEVTDLLRKRRVHIKLGITYVKTRLLKSVIVSRFDNHLKMQIESFRGSYYGSLDPRVPGLIDDLQKGHKYLGIDPLNIAAPSIEHLDKLAVKSFPPCMRKLHEALRANHHLRHEGRIQYTLFLKSLNIPVDEALEFFRKEFTQKVTAKSFKKEYTYYVRHVYGLVGGKLDYKLPNCSSITKYKPSAGEYHGCLFEVSDIEDLGKKLTGWQIPSIQKKEITQLTRERKFHQACAAYFDGTHGCYPILPIVNPMDFYRQSLGIGNDRK